MSDLKNFQDYSNDKLIEMMGTLNTNHEKIKFEIIVLSEMLNNIHNDYVAIAKELNSR